MLPALLALILALVLLCAGLGAVLAAATEVDPRTAYLATTPGGLFAVLATAADAGSDVTYVLALQLFQLLVILAALPLVARLGRERATGAAQGRARRSRMPTWSRTPGARCSTTRGFRSTPACAPPTRTARSSWGCSARRTPTAA